LSILQRSLTQRWQDDTDITGLNPGPKYTIFK
jgi:hypothetical protein